MRLLSRLFLLVACGLFSWFFLSCDHDEKSDASISTAESEHIVHQLYNEILNRDPDPEGLRVYTNYLAREGKDAEWLRRVLWKSSEAKRIRGFSLSDFVLNTFTLVALISCAGILLLRRPMLARISSSLQVYLTAGISLSPVAGILLLILTYGQFYQQTLHDSIFIGLIIGMGLVLLKTPRWVLYILVICAMLAVVQWHVFVDAEGNLDPLSDRDDAAEIAAEAFLDGENPWSRESTAGLRITSGPSSILLSLPFVAFQGRINTLSFLAWCSFFVLLVFADLRGRNNTLLTIIVLLLFPAVGFLHTLHHGLDELFYASIVSPVLWFLLKQGWLGLAGVFAGYIVLSRLSYVPGVFAALLWWAFGNRRSASQWLRGMTGVLAYVLPVLGIFWIVSGESFLTENFWINSQMPSLNKHDNVVVSFASTAVAMMPGGRLDGIILVLALTTVICFSMRRLSHPFFQMAIALFLAHTISFSPSYPLDYQMIFLIPAIYGFAFTHRPCAGNEANRGANSELANGARS